MHRVREFWHICKKKNKAQYVCFGLISFILMTFCFYTNALDITDYSSFDRWQDGSSALVVNRIILSRNEGILSRAGFSVYNAYGTCDEWVNEYLGGDFLEEEHNTPYTAQIGLAGITASALDAMLPFEGLDFLRFLNLLDCAAFSLLISLLAVWFLREFGLFSALLVVAAAIFSYWTTLYAHNFYWVIWTLLFPFILVLLLHMLEERFAKPRRGWLFFLAAFFAVFIRAACGYEFISTVLVASEIPVLYYALKNRWGGKRYLLRSVWVGAGGLAGFAGAVGINLAQKTVFYGSFLKAWETLATDIFKRTGFYMGAGTEVYSAFSDSLNASPFQVLNSYFVEGEPLVLNFRMSIFLLLLLLCGALCFTYCATQPGIDGNKRRLQGLITASAFSLLAPLSWFILAKAHSFQHTHFNYLLWFVPSVFLIAACVGALLQRLFLDLWVHLKRPYSRIIATLLCLFILGLPVISAYRAWEYPSTLKLITSVTQEGQLLYEDDNNRVFLFANNLYFMVSKGYNINSYFFVDSMPTPSLEDPGKVASQVVFWEEDLNLPPWQPYRVATAPLPAAFPYVYFGQANYQGEPLWSDFAEVAIN